MALHLILILGLFLLAVAVTMVLRALTTPRGPSTETIEQIGHYGFAGSLPAGGSEGHDLDVRQRVDDFVASAGRWFGSRFSRLKGKDYRARLITAGMYTWTPDRLLGTQFLGSVGGAVVAIWLAALAGGGPLLFLALIGGLIVGWILPTFIVDSRGRKRCEQVERALPDLIDLLVVTLEAGLSFPQSLRLAATKIKEPLASEVRLTLQEQNMGLTTEEALRNMLVRVDTPAMRSFVRAVTQGEALGVSIGDILRSLANEMRKRRRAAAEERAQKAPVKILFPLVFLIFPAMFVILLGPAVFDFLDAFK